MGQSYMNRLYMDDFIKYFQETYPEYANEINGTNYTNRLFITGMSQFIIEQEYWNELKIWNYENVPDKEITYNANRGLIHFKIESHRDWYTTYDNYHDLAENLVKFIEYKNMKIKLFRKKHIIDLIKLM